MKQSALLGTPYFEYVDQKTQASALEILLCKPASFLDAHTDNAQNCGLN